MSKRRVRRTITLLSASALSLGIASSGVLISNANASTSTPGVTAKTITIGASVPISGIASSYAPVSAAANAVFKWINKLGGINGRDIKYIRLDDCYGLAAVDASCTAGASTTPLSVNKVLVAQDHVFATVGSLGTQAEESVMNYLKGNGVPQLFVASGSIAWNNPSKYPDLFGYQTSYVMEGKIFARYLRTNDAGQTVGFIGQNDDFGADGYLGLADGGLKIASANNLTYNAADAITGVTSDITADVSTLQTNKVQVVVLDSVPGFTQGILETAHALGYSPKWIISSVGSDPTLVNTVLEDGATSLDYFPATNSNANPWVPWLRKVLEADRTDFPGFKASSVISGNDIYGAGYAVAFAETLRAEGKDVTRAGFVKTLESTTLSTPATMPLRYTKGNHQGLTGGAITAVLPNGTSAPQYAQPTKTIFTTTDAGDSPLTVVSKPTVQQIPSWLK
jgi:ABC-type branched-subunit amino acid transport system substrate-binding protein